MCICLGRCVFNLLILVTSIIPWIIAAFPSYLYRKCTGRRCSCLSSFTLILFSISWRLAVKMCCWITVDWSVVDEFAAQHGKGGRPVLIVCNHTSFFDAFIMCCLFPVCSVAKLCTVASQTLFNIPFMGVIGWGMGALPIKFKSTNYASTEMAVDKDTVADMMIQLKDAAAQGCILGWFPEGRLNREDPDKLSLFRAGLFSIATELDCELWTVAIVGNSLMWPPDGCGGNPARIGIKFARFCESTQEFIQSKGVQADAREAGRLLAKETQQRTQALVNELLDEGYINGHPLQTAETLLRQNAKL